MLKNKYIIGLSFMFCALLGCVEDKTVDTFKELNEVTIEGLEDKYSVMLYSHLQASPTIKTSLNDNSQLSYVWYAYTNTTREEADTLGYEQNLDVLVEPSILTPGEAYTLALKVIDGETGVYYRKEMELEIRTQFTKGTVLLCEEAGQAEVNFLVDDTERTLLENIYASANDELVGRNPLRIYSVNPNDYATFLKQELIFCDDENGGVVASPLSFEKVKTMREACDMDFETATVAPEFYYKGNMIDYIIMNGAICKRATNMQAVNFEPKLVLMNEPYEYSVAPDVLAAGDNPVFFDELYGRLIIHPRYNQGYVTTLPKAENDLGIFDSNNLGENLELKCWGSLSEATNGAWMLMQDVEGKYWLYKFSLEDDSFRGIAKIEVTDAIAPHMKEAISFAANPEYNDVFMYATKDAVYSFAANQLTSSTMSSLEVLQQNMQAENMEVTSIKFLDITVSEPTASNPNATRTSSQVRCCVRDLNLSEKQGGVIFYEVNSTGGVHLEFLFEKCGFCDKVIDIDEKYS